MTTVKTKIEGFISPFTEEEVNNAFGFVYMIRHIESGRWYIGKKQSKRKITRPPLKGKKRRRIEYKESDWKTYWSSSARLQEAVLAEGTDAFERIILCICQSKIDLSYSEVECQILLNAVASSNSYNGNIGANQYGSLHSGIERNGLSWVTSVLRYSPDALYESPVFTTIMSAVGNNEYTDTRTKPEKKARTIQDRGPAVSDEEVSELVDLFG